METRSLADGLDSLRATADASFRLAYTFGRVKSKLQTEIQRVASEIQGIAGALHQLSLLAAVLGDGPGCHGTSGAVPSQLISCHRTLETLERRLRRRETDTRRPENAAGPKWPFTTAWTTDLIGELGELRDAIARGLSAESTADLAQVFSNEKRVMVVDDVDQHGAVSKHTRVSAVVAARPGALDVLGFFLKFDQRALLDNVLRASHALHSFRFFQTPGFEDWLDDGGDDDGNGKRSSKLWITAPAGAGKTVFAGAMVRESILRRRGHAVVAYVFCGFGDTRTCSPVNVLSTIAAQVGRQNEAAFSLLRAYHRELHRDNKRRVQRPTSEHLQRLLWEMSKCFGHVMIIVDGVDECGIIHSDINSTNVVESLAALVNNTDQQDGGGALGLAIVSRETESIRNVLREGFKKVDIVHSDDELLLFTATELERRVARGHIKFDDPEMKDEAIRKLSFGSDITFWQIRCHIDLMCTLKSHDAMLEFLQTMPCSLESTYTVILKGFSKKSPASQSLIQAALLLVAFSNPPLTTQELCQALSTVDRGTGDARDAAVRTYPEVDETEVLNQCGVLLRKSALEERIEFSHYTVREFLASIDPSDPDLAGFSLNEARVNRMLASCALRFLCLEDFSRFPGLSLSEETFIQNRHARFPFYRFAALTWHKLVADSSSSPDDAEPWLLWSLLPEAMVLFDPAQTANFKSWCLEACRHYLLHGSCSAWRDERDAPPRMDAEDNDDHAGSVCSETTQVADVSTDSAFNTSDGDSSKSEPEMAVAVAVGSRSVWRWRPHAPRRHWHRGHTRRLARIVRRGDFTPLHMAALLGIDAVCHELIERGESVDRPSRIGTPLHCALGGPFLIACHDMSTQRRPDDGGWLERPSRETVALLIRSGADCTRPLPSQTYSSWETRTIGALALKAAEWAGAAAEAPAGDCELFGLVVRAGAQLHETDMLVFRALCRRWAKDRDRAALSMIVSVLDLLGTMVAAGEGESAAAYLKAFQTCVSETMDVDDDDDDAAGLACSAGVSDDMMIRDMWKAIGEDRLGVLERRLSNPRCAGLLRGGETLTGLLEFAAASSSIACLDHLLTRYADDDDGLQDRKAAMVLNCITHKSEDVLACLLKHGSGTTQAGYEGNTVWHLAARLPGSHALLKCLHAHVDPEACAAALRSVNKAGQTPLAGALLCRCHQQASTIIRRFPGDASILRSTKPPLSRILANIQHVDVLRELHANGMVPTTTDSPLNHLERQATIDVVRELLSTYDYTPSESGRTPLENYMMVTKLRDYKQAVLVALLQAELAQTEQTTEQTTVQTTNTTRSIWAYACRILRETLKHSTGTGYVESVRLLRTLIDHGCLESYEKKTGLSGLKEIGPLFGIGTEKAAPADHNSVAATEDVFVLVWDSTTRPGFLQSSDLDVVVLRWAVYHDSVFLFDRLLRDDARVDVRVDVRKRGTHESNALEFLCSHGGGPNGYRMLVGLLERVGDKADLDRLTPSGEGLGLLHRLGLVDSHVGKTFGCPSFRSVAAPPSSYAAGPSPPPPPPPPKGYSVIGAVGFAQARRPLENPKFSLVQRLLEEKVDCHVPSRTRLASPLGMHVSAGYVDTARLILRHGGHASLRAADVYGWTPVAWACAHGYTELLGDMAAAAAAAATGAEVGPGTGAGAGAGCPESIWDFKVQVSVTIWGTPAQLFKDFSALHLAAMASPGTVQFLLDGGFATDLDVAAADLSTPLHLATYFGLSDTIRLLVSRGSDINARTAVGITPLHMAVLHQNEPTAALLLELGACHLKTKRWETPLDIAMSKNNRRLMDLVSKSLRRLPADQLTTTTTTTTTTTGDTDRVQRHLTAAMAKAMEDAIEKRNHAACKRLLRDGCPPDIKMRSCHTCTALVFALSRKTISTAIVDALIAEGASFRGVSCARERARVSFFPGSGVRFFEDESSEASSYESRSTSSDSEEDEEDDEEDEEDDEEDEDEDEDAEEAVTQRWPLQGSTCLDFLMGETDSHLSDKVSEWLDAMPDEDMVWLLDNSSAVRVAIDANAPEALEALFSRVSDIDRVSNGGRDLVRELVNKAPTRRTGFRESAPLHQAARWKRVKMARLLLRHGADVDRRNQAQETPLHVAVKAESPAMVSLLLDHGASLRAREKRGHTPLELAISDAGPATVQRLLDRGARVGRNLASGSNLMCDSTRMAVSMLRAGIRLDQVGSFGIPVWTPALFNVELATYVLNSDCGGGSGGSGDLTFGATATTGRVMWKLLWYVHVIDDGRPMHRSLRLLYRRLGAGAMRRIVELQAGDGDDARDAAPFSLLCFCASYGLAEEVRVLVRMGCDVEFEGSAAGTALMAAAREGRTDVVKLLVLAGGARVQYQRDDGVWRSAVAAAADFPEVLSWLLVGRYSEQARIEESPSSSSCWDNRDLRDQDGRGVRPWSGYWKGVFPLQGKYARCWGDSMLLWLSRLEKAKRNCRGKVVISHLRDLGSSQG
ncbi:Ankyrin-3 [Colletotrichum tanaceti]|nr:Ankyrin-3 [Colletotrichum tanaceti]